MKTIQDPKHPPTSTLAADATASAAEPAEPCEKAEPLGKRTSWLGKALAVWSRSDATEVSVKRHAATVQPDF